MQKLGLAQVVSDFREDVKHEARCDAAQHHVLHAAKAEEAQAEGGRHQHHCDEQGGSRQKLLVLQPVTGCGEARALGLFDEERQIPERYRVRSGKAFAHLLDREIGGEHVFRRDDRRLIQRVSLHALQAPESAGQGRSLRFDALAEMVLVVIDEDGDAAELHALVAAGHRVDDRLAGCVFLADPETASGALQAGLLRAADIFDLEALRLFLQVCGAGIVGRGREHAEHESDEEGRGDELPGRYASRARDDEFQAARQVQVAHHRADEHRERHQDFHQLRDAGQRNRRADERRRVRRIAAAPDQLDIVDERHQAEAADENREQCAEEAPTEIAR